jgi:hypothetical protein
MGARGCAALIALCLLPATAASAVDQEPGYEWLENKGGGNVSLAYGSPETAEDFLFALSCRNKDKLTDMTVYVDIAGTKVGQAMPIELSVGTAQLTVQGKVTTDEMSGFHFAEAKGFKIKPVIALLKGKGPVTATTGKVVSTMSEKGRDKALAAFAKACTLD